MGNIPALGSKTEKYVDPYAFCRWSENFRMRGLRIFRPSGKCLMSHSLSARHAR